MKTQTFSVRKKFHFCYTHRLHELGPGHKCWNLHGHNGTVEIIIESEQVNSDGFVTDFGNLKFVQKWIDDNWDHSVIVGEEDKDLLAVINVLKSKSYVLRYTSSSTSENLCIEIYKSLISDILSLLDRDNILIIGITINFYESSSSSAALKISFQ
jgi:6-pyruvoyl tetrahydropterin synthase/QueD family protein